MNKIFRMLISVLSIGTLILLSACGDPVGGNSPVGGGPVGGELVGEPQGATSLTYEERRNAAFDDLKASAELFASQFASSVNRTASPEKNFAVSPISVYMALALSAECTAGETRDELLSAVNISYPALKTQFSDFYRSLIAEYKTYEGEVIGMLDLSNSIWMDKSMQPKEECIQDLAGKYLCYSYSTDFRNDNTSANQAIREFVKDKTRGLIDQDFQLDTETLFALINTLYLKDIWNDEGDDLSFTKEKYDFTERDDTVKSLNLLQGHYRSGRAIETESFTHFYTQTYHGYKIKFILPKEGYTVDNVFTEANLAAVNAITDYNAIDQTNKIEYSTRCLFPEFNADFDQDVKPILQSEFGVQKFFTSNVCNFSTLTDEDAFCTQVKHVTKLKIDKTGVEGAAVTIGVNGATSVDPEEYTRIYEDFVLDRAFGFILTDRYDVTLFSGVVNQI